MCDYHCFCSNCHPKNDHCRICDCILLDKNDRIDCIIPKCVHLFHRNCINESININNNGIKCEDILDQSITCNKNEFNSVHYKIKETFKRTSYVSNSNQQYYSCVDYKHYTLRLFDIVKIYVQYNNSNRTGEGIARINNFFIKDKQIMCNVSWFYTFWDAVCYTFVLSYCTFFWFLS